MIQFENQLDPSRRRVDKKLTHDVLPRGSNNYKAFINNWREELSDKNKIGDVHVLPTPPDNEQLSRFIHVKYTCYSKGEKHKCVGKFKRQDLYFVGVRNGLGKQWFSLEGSEIDIGNSESIGLNVSHGSLVGGCYRSLDEVVTNQNELVNAIIFFSTLTKEKLIGLKNQAARHCLVLIIMYCEAARSNSIRDDVAENWSGHDMFEKKKLIMDDDPGTWKTSIIHHWMKMSDLCEEVQAC
ncbi:hypothetical protein CASFOL_025756 [Castilleja foliolosa]|uniref:rRNA N-glycosylase n=1 Tax=Castilleja foliolosa TaxID=1961234 RepID=A0ABD3CT10_9LAMI